MSHKRGTGAARRVTRSFSVILETRWQFSAVWFVHISQPKRTRKLRRASLAQMSADVPKCIKRQQIHLTTETPLANAEGGADGSFHFCPPPPLPPRAHTCPCGPSASLCASLLRGVVERAAACASKGLGSGHGKVTPGVSGPRVARVDSETKSELSAL